MGFLAFISPLSMKLRQQPALKQDPNFYTHIAYKFLWTCTKGCRSCQLTNANQRCIEVLNMYQFPMLPLNAEY